ncbi:MAG: efflux RND transporter periplasmic adaptor subunit [Gammaproteobacteria bacterium]|nr:efflux RND transporter periplasmic adaptor subunit [Gammaproteobacteria bacterium]
MRVKVLAFLILLLPQLAWSIKPLPVTVAELKSVLFYPTRTAPANVVSRNDSKISAEVSAVIERIPVEVGQVVEPGTPLVELHQSDINLAIREAEATMKSLQAQSEQASSQLQRVRSLASKQSVTAELLGQRETEVKVSVAALTAQKIRVESLQRELNKTIARAPFKAIVIERIANVGELAMPGTPLVRVMDASNIEVVAELQSYDVPSLSHASSALLVTRNNEYTVRLKRIIPVIDEQERSQEVRLDFVGSSALIGTDGHLAWRENSPYLPADLLVRRNGFIGVFVEDGGTARFVEFPNAEEGRPIMNILPLNSRVIKDGRFVVQDGQLLRINSEKSDPPTADQQAEVSPQAASVISKAANDE